MCCEEKCRQQWVCWRPRGASWQGTCPRPSWRCIWTTWTWVCSAVRVGMCSWACHIWTRGAQAYQVGCQGGWAYTPLHASPTHRLGCAWRTQLKLAQSTGQASRKICRDPLTTAILAERCHIASGWNILLGVERAYLSRRVQERDSMRI